MSHSLSRKYAAPLLASLLGVMGSPSTWGQAFLSPDVTHWSVPINRDDVKAIGMGNTQVANGKVFNAMEYNPALLAHERTSFDVIQVQASLPLNSFDAFAFLRDNRDQLKTGAFYQAIDDGFKAYTAPGATAKQQAAAIQQINSGLTFVNQFQQKVLGPADNPNIQGAMVVPDIQVQVGSLGFALHATLRAALSAYPGEILSKLYALQLPDNLSALTADQQQTLGDFVALLHNHTTGQPIYQNAVPPTFAVSYLDIVGMAGYGYKLNPDISLGADLKILNRRISTKVVTADNYKSLLSDLRSDFQNSVTGVTLDLGGLYHLKSTGTDFGLTLQNIIPLPKTTSNVVFTTPTHDALGNLQISSMNVPVEFSVPFLMNLGVTHPIMHNWEASFDWVDIAAQDERHVNFGGRLRLGTEFRLDAIPNSLGIAFRGGVAERKLAGGVGLNLFRAVQIDGAYAWDNYVKDDAVYVQLRFGW